jgi:hypothetical protein
MNTCFVGWSHSELDIPIMLDTYKLLEPLNITKFDFVNLHQGRDFIKEDKIYDIVVLIYIFKWTKEQCQNDNLYNKHDSSIKVSDIHTPENWRKRLLNTEAKEILIFGYSDESEITGNYIGDLENYKMNLIEFKLQNNEIYGRIWRYTKENKAR